MKNNNKTKKVEIKVVAENIKNTLKNLWVSHKKSWIITIVCIIVAIAFGIGAKYAGSDEFKSNMVLKMIPETIESETTDKQEMVFYKEANPDHDGNTEISLDNLLKMYNYYYLDEDGNKVYVDNGLYKYQDNSNEEQLIVVSLGFIMTGLAKIDAIKTALKVTAWVVFAVGIIVAIVLWYIKDKKYQESLKKPIVHKKKKNR